MIIFTTSMTGQHNVEVGQIGFSNNDVDGAFGRFHIFVRPNGTSVERFMITDTGHSYTNNGDVESLSDVRIKKDIEDLTDGLDVVNQLRPRTYRLNGKGEMSEDEGDPDDVTRYGFIADEVLSVASQYVTILPGKIGGVKYDDVKSMGKTRLIPMIVKAIQELSTKVTALEDA
jgi:hypothetical protein